ncbi:uncharacterized protein BDCG_00580 [Blastomyces dermatitidis ER-3]|uniref:Erythromycin esterase n=1 Tax=Ajellomyces dermatitidis (strain ER-3 / ATCC MYA-2586) TaxID=559297 RepID=A0ABP2EKS0_AJEDR|nr:uncharacterized protein BDCG_00580 [Blastomyces dermatitidis ER-3]EEQ83775.1 hypothetical protein BDCG_00580 [Blastomyces dermatitidis ER-3]
MATPVRRRSARLRSITPASEPQKQASKHSTKLVSVAERDENPVLCSPENSRTVPATPPTHSTSITPAAGPPSNASLKTPKTVGALKLGLGEMLLSKVHHTTPKKPDSGVCLGFKPIQKDPHHPSNASAATPTKSRLSVAEQLDTPSFSIQFSCEDSQLSEEAQKLMENIREDASRIKAQMIVEQNAQKHKSTEAGQAFGVRKIAKAKGKAGRFSNAHMAEFKKMDSIAGHPSSFRVRQERIHPSPVKPSLKRTSSKACLDEVASSVKSTASFASPTKTIANNPVKRSKSSNIDSTPARKPLFKDGLSDNKLDPKSGQDDPRSLTTPTKSAISRASSVKQIKTTRIPNFPCSPSTKSIVAPRTPQTEFNPKLKTTLPSLTNLKSILRRRQPLFSNDPVKIAAGTHVAPPAKTFNIQEAPTVKKHVDFSASTKVRHAFADLSPTTSSKNLPPEPAKSGVISYPTLPPTTPPKASKAAKLAFGNSPTIRAVGASEVQYPSFPNHATIPHGIMNKKRRRDEEDDEDVENKMPENSKCDERSQKRLKPIPAITNIHTPSPIKNRPMQRGTPGIGTPSRSIQKSRGVLSMSRLNMLSKPKTRR